MRIALNKIRNQYDEDSKEAVEGLKPEGFDALAQKQDKTEEEQKLYNEMYQKLVDEHNAFLVEKSKEEVEFDRNFTEDEFNELVYVNSDSVKINDVELSAEDFLEIIYSLTVV